MIVRVGKGEAQLQLTGGGALFEYDTLPDGIAIACDLDARTFRISWSWTELGPVSVELLHHGDEFESEPLFDEDIEGLDLEVVVPRGGA